MINNNIKNNIKFILDTQGITSLVIGTINPEHLKDNCLAATSK